MQIVEAILAKCKAEDRENWLKQMADNLSTAAQNSPKEDKAAYTRLGGLLAPPRLGCRRRPKHRRPASPLLRA